MEQQIYEAMRSYGIEPPDRILFNTEKVVRFGKKNACWYVFYSDEITAGAFGDWRDNSTYTWCEKKADDFTKEQKAQFKLRMDQAREAREAERIIAQQEAKELAEKIWEQSQPVMDHPYLDRKKIKPCGARLNKDRLVIPLYNQSGEMTSLQFIDTDGNKKFLTNGQVKDCYFRIGKPNGNVCIAEGFATAASIHEATGYAVIVAFNAGKLVDCAKFIRSKMTKANLIICADYDKLGIEKATLAAEESNGVMIYPDFGDNKEGFTDFNDLHVSRGLDSVRNAIIKDKVESNILDADVKYSSVDVVQFVEDEHILKRLSMYISEKTYLPVSTVFLAGLGVFSSIACREFSVTYQDHEKLPIGLYVVTEQPSGSGKSRCLKYFQKPFYEMSESSHEDIRKELAELSKHEGDLDEEEEKLLAELQHKTKVLGNLFTTNATAEGLEKGLSETNGFFSAISSEQGLFNVLFGGSYKADRANNNDVALNGFDGGFINSARVTRKGYCGHVVGGIVCFAQSGSIETLLNSSNGTGLSERFLMLAEPHSLGIRDHERESTVMNDLYLEYAEKCKILESSLSSCDKFSNTVDLYISDTGFALIRQYLNSIEPHLKDGGKFSHASLRGAASKIDMQIMKIAANLRLLGEKLDFWSGIDDKYVEMAIAISNEMLEANLKLCQDKGVLGCRAEFEAILRLFEDNGKPRIERAIIQSRSKVSPFKEFSGNRSIKIRETLAEMVEQGILSKNSLGGITSYTAI
jgi:phage/plasmid primase-like uncharacterized protein